MTVRPQSSLPDGLGSQYLAQGCACPLGRWMWLLGAFPTFLASLASLYGCFQARPMHSTPRDQTHGDRAWTCSLGSLGRPFPQIADRVCPPA